MAQQQKTKAAEQHPLTSLEGFLQNLRDGDNLDVLIATTIAYLQQEYDYNFIWIAVYHRLNHTLIGKDGILPNGDRNFARQRVLLDPGTLLEQVVIEQRAVGVADLRSETRAHKWQELAQKHKIQGAMILPLRHKGHCLGVALLGNQRWGYLLAGETKAKLMMVMGELGVLLYQHEMEWQYQQSKRPEKSLLQLLEGLQTLENLSERLENVVHTTHQLINPSRTNIYWFDRQHRYFWLRVSNQPGKVGFHQTQPVLGGIKLDELSDFYYALAVNQVVWMGDNNSSVKSSFTKQLLKRLKARSVLAAPIIWQKDLLGFLAVENHQSRNWTEAEQSFVKGAAGLISLVSPLDTIETSIQKIQADAELTSQVAQAVYSHQELEVILRSCAVKVLERLTATRFLLLQYNQENNNYQFLYQNQSHNRYPLTFGLEALKEIDHNLLHRATTTISIENLEEDLRFYNWRDNLLNAGARSLLISNCRQGHRPDAILLVVGESHRSWSVQEQELLLVIAQQIGVIVRQLQLHTQHEQQQKILHSFQESLNLLETSQNPHTQVEENYLEQSTLERIADAIKAPLVTLLSWKPGDLVATVLPGIITEENYKINISIPIDIATEALIQWALVTESYLSFCIDDIPEESKKWLIGDGISQILLFPVRTTTEEKLNAVILIADHSQRQWSEVGIEAVQVLVSQLAWSRRWLHTTQMLQSQTDELQQLNWYKHQYLSDVQRNVSTLLNHIKDAPESEYANIRYQPIIRQLDYVTPHLTELLNTEQWQLNISNEKIPVATLLKRTLERVDDLLQQQKLWVGVHGLGSQPNEVNGGTRSSHRSQSSLVIAGDIFKIELVIYQVLLAACKRSNVGGRIDIWCRRLDESNLEISITDLGNIDLQLLENLALNQSKNINYYDYVSQPIGFNLVVCQQLVQKMGGELQINQLPDHRVLSRLLLPLANH
ncbi:MAG: GAF domain-containing protein [Calothrix sp. MO_192.B10]|nr:GAF domain-containing protein [Calothrix sp. MO_192.B10]